MANKRTITYSTIDVCKLMMALFVVLIHIEAIYQLRLSDAMMYLTRTAVPFFFIAAGFLLHERMKSSENPKEIIQKYTVRIFKMYIFWTVIYSPIALYMNFHGRIPAFQAIKQYIKGVILVGESYYSWHLWFLLALLVSLIMIRFLLKLRVNIITMFILGLVMMCIGQYMDYLYRVPTDSICSAIIIKYYAFFMTTRNGIFQGFCFVTAGMLLNKITPPFQYAQLIRECGLSLSYGYYPYCYLIKE